MYGNTTQAAMFLLNTLFDLYILVLIVRLLLAFARANYFNPVTQVVIKLTQPLVAPLRRLLPTYHGIEFATLALILLFEIIKFSCLSWLTMGVLNISDVLLFSLIDSLRYILKTYFYAILLQAILTWFQPGHSPAAQVLEQMTAPILRPLRRVIPLIHGIDISPIPALIILQVLIILLP